MKPKGKPGSGVGSPPRPKQCAAVISDDGSSLYTNISLPLDCPSVAEREFNAKVMEQLPGLPEPRIMVLLKTPKHSVELDAQHAANHHGEPVAIVDMSARLLAYRKPELQLHPPTELGRKVDRELDADRNYFKRRPDRQHYIRRIFKHELAELVKRSGSENPIPHDKATQAVFVAVKQVAKGARVRVFFVGQRDTDTDCSEQTARAVFEIAAPEETKQIAAGLKKAAAG